MFTLTVEVLDKADHPSAIGLLAPRALDTTYQTFHGLTWSEDWVGQDINERISGQSATMLTNGDSAPLLRYAFATPGPQDGPQTYAAFTNRYTTASPELMSEIENLVSEDSRVTAARIVAHTAERFDYGHPDERFNAGQDTVPVIACGTAKGSCIDINTYLISSLSGAKIPTVYFAGYFFPAERGGVTNDMHCWVSSWAGGQRQDWDIAHHMKMGADTVCEGYNPKPGTRFAMTYGRGLTFDIAGVKVELSHFSEPRWVFQDGTTRTARIKARLHEGAET